MSFNFIKTNKKFRFLIVLLLLFFAMLFYMNRETPDTRSIDTHVSLTTNEMISLLEKESSKNLQDYIEKAIEIKGVLKEVTHRGGKTTLILAGDEDNKYILCEMQDDQAIKVEKLKNDTMIVVKGIFKGVLLDAILLNCILIDGSTYE